MNKAVFKPVFTEPCSIHLSVASTDNTIADIETTKNMPVRLLPSPAYLYEPLRTNNRITGRKNGCNILVRKRFISVDFGKESDNRKRREE